MAEDLTLNRPMVLVVDDEPIIADTLVRILEHQGYTASAAYTGEAAFMSALLTPPALLISDVGLPKINGFQLAHMVQRLFPECGVILSSGRSSEDRRLAGRETEDPRFLCLQKPVHPEIMLEHVSKSLRLRNLVPRTIKPRSSKLRTFKPTS